MELKKFGFLVLTVTKKLRVSRSKDGKKSNFVLASKRKDRRICKDLAKKSADGKFLAVE